MCTSNYNGNSFQDIFITFRVTEIFEIKFQLIMDF